MIVCGSEYSCSTGLLRSHICFPISRGLPSLQHRLNRTLLPIRANGGADFWQLLGGRGLPGGEDCLKDDRKRKDFFDKFSSETENTSLISKGIVKEELQTKQKEVSSLSGMEEGFEKEMMGLTGGFPGGETGLKKFIQENPAPSMTKAGAAGMSYAAMAVGKEQSLRKATAPPLPLMMPGMTVVVKNPKNPYHMYGGIVQRVSDGRVGVLLEGGNWDKLLTFYLEELERTPSGPPMTNPKSTVLLVEQQVPSPPSPAGD